MYNSVNKLLHDIYKLKNKTIFIDELTEYELSILKKEEYEYIKKLFKSNNVKVVKIKEKTLNKFIR